MGTRETIGIVACVSSENFHLARTTPPTLEQPNARQSDSPRPRIPAGLPLRVVAAARHEMAQAWFRSHLPAAQHGAFLEGYKTGKENASQDDFKLIHHSAASPPQPSRRHGYHTTKFLSAIAAAVTGIL